MTRRTLLAAVVAVAVAVVAAVAIHHHTRDPWGDGSPCASAAALPFDVVSHGDTGSIDVPTRVTVARTPAEVDTAWSRLYRDSRPRPATPPLGSAKWLAVLVELGSRPYGGWGLDVKRVVPTEHGVEVCAIEWTPSSGSAHTQAVIAPYEMLRVPVFPGTAHLTLRQIESPAPE